MACASCFKRVILPMVLLLTTGFTSGCASHRVAEGPRRWTVKPHQRALLADRIMQVDADRLERAADLHVLSTREGAVGGLGTAGGGCGCN